MGDEPSNNNGGRTHEPSLREAVADLDGFKSEIRAVMAERDKRYEERFESQKEAIATAYENLKEYKDRLERVATAQGTVSRDWVQWAIPTVFAIAALIVAVMTMMRTK